VDVPLLCGHDLAVRMPNPRGIEQCIRILVLYNTGKRQKEMTHVYLRGARAIKRDLDQYRTQLEEVFR
jgi:chorismate mutase